MTTAVHCITTSTRNICSVDHLSLLLLLLLLLCTSFYLRIVFLKIGGFVTPIRALEWVHWHAFMGAGAFFLLLVAPSPELVAALREVRFKNSRILTTAFRRHFPFF